MLSKKEAQSIANNQNYSTAEGAGVEASIKAAAQLGGFLASYTFPVNFSSANLKESLELEGYAVTVTESQVLGVAATYTGTPTGAATAVTITADAQGTAGNAIALAFDGVLTISEALDAFNIANPENTASLISGDGDQVPDDVVTVSLASGVNAVAEIISIDFGADEIDLGDEE